MQEQLANLQQKAKAKRIKLDPVGTWPLAWHRFEPGQVEAIAAALLSGRPLLLRGEPGVGKSQLARAAAACLERHFLSTVVQPDSEAGELLWSLDHTRRLADAQMQKSTDDTRTYIGPGALWWALDWDSAWRQYYRGVSNFIPPGVAREATAPAVVTSSEHAWDAVRSAVEERYPEPIRPAQHANGMVLLIDEVEKGDLAFAHTLLEVLGNGSFTVPPLGKEVHATGTRPLVIMTSNDTRELPAALLRRCVVLKMTLEDDPVLLKQRLLRVGAAHFEDMDAEVLASAADQIIEDRATCKEPPRTGQAEYLDLLGALDKAAPKDPEAQREWLQRLAKYFFKSEAVER